MKYKMNKKGKSTSGPIGIVWAIIIGIIFLIFFFGGGISALSNISKFIKVVPSFIWIILGIVLLIKWVGKK